MSYSPSQTELFARCPLKWWLQRRRGWTTSYVAKNELAMWMGTAIHDGVAHYFIHNRKPTLMEVQTVVDLKWNAEIANATSNSRILDNEDEKLAIEGLLSRAGKLITEQDPFPLSYKIEHIEGVFDDGSRIDLGGHDNNNIPFFADWKSTKYCQKDDIASRLRDYAFSHQMMQYAWQFSKAINEVTRRYFIAFVVMAPKPLIHLESYELSTEMLDRWHVSAQQWWGQMSMWLELSNEKGPDWVTAHIPMSPVHKDGWSRCEMYDACVDYQLDEELMRTKYIQIERKA
jgi:hypothetical protein